MAIFTAVLKRSWSLLLIVLLLLVAAGGWWWTWTRRQARAEAIASAVAASPEAQHRLFRKWVGDRFGRSVFKRLAPDAEDNAVTPDLLVAFQTSSEKDLFAVFCQWRPRFDERHVEVASPTQLEEYQHLAHQEACRVFVVIGVAGTPTAPTDIYVLSLDELGTGVVDMGLLVPFKQRSPNGTFYYYPEDGRLALFGPPRR